jgi:heptosyltransferase-2
MTHCDVIGHWSLVIGHWSLMKIGIFLPNWIGDVVMATPFLRAMHARFGGSSELIGIMKPYVGQVLRGTPWLSSILRVGDKKKDSDALSHYQLVGKLRDLRLDMAVLLTNSFRTAALAWLSGAKQRVGYRRDWRSWLLTDGLTTPRAHGRWAIVPAVDYYLELAYLVGCPPQSRNIALPLNAEDDAAAEAAWRQLGWPANRRVISFHIAGGWGGKATAKAWPLEHFAELANRIAASGDHRVLVLCGPNEREAAAELVRRVDHPHVKSLAEIKDLPLALTKGCLARSELLVTTDSGPRHIGTALNVPVVALFGATDPRWTETYHPRALTLYKQLPCSPCAKQHCPLGHHRCMRELSVDNVLAAVQRQLSAPLSAAA